jgi:hypothetical protein
VSFHVSGDCSAASDGNRYNWASIVKHEIVIDERVNKGEYTRQKLSGIKAYNSSRFFRLPPSGHGVHLQQCLDEVGSQAV